MTGFEGKMEVGNCSAIMCGTVNHLAIASFPGHAKAGWCLGMRLGNQPLEAVVDIPFSSLSSPTSDALM